MEIFSLLPARVFETKRTATKTVAVLVAAELGFEPRQTESESVVLTVTLFGNVFFNAVYLITFFLVCQEKSEKKKAEKMKIILKNPFYCAMMRETREIETNNNLGKDSL